MLTIYLWLSIVCLLLRCGELLKTVFKIISRKLFRNVTSRDTNRINSLEVSNVSSNTMHLYWKLWKHFRLKSKCSELKNKNVLYCFHVARNYTIAWASFSPGTIHPCFSKTNFDITFPWRSIFLFFSSLAHDAVADGIKNRQMLKVLHI